MEGEEKQHFPTAHFMTSAACYKDLPQHDGLEFCIVGRSNVGKSSFINHLFGSNCLARVSKTPGRTTLANFYGVSDGTVWVDLPGYGYAHAPRGDRHRFGRLVQEYCENRPNLRGVIWLCDIRHPGQGLDIVAYEWLGSLGVPVCAVLTKADKISKHAVRRNLLEYSGFFCFDPAPILYSIHGNGPRAAFFTTYETWSKQAGGAGRIR
jgi:GTP-binding protein